jgi:plasmid maintenance system killer protein
MAIYSLRQNGTLMSEASVQAAPLIDNNGNPFADGHTLDLYVQGKSNRFPPEITRRALRKLEYLDSATGLDDLKVPPSNRLHELERGEKRTIFNLRERSMAHLIPICGRRCF